MPGLKESAAHASVPPADRATVLARLSDALSARNDIAYAYAHGSFVEGLPFRDIDIAVARRGTGRDASGDPLFWTSALADALGPVAGYPVDVQVLDDAPLTFRSPVYQGTLLCAADEDRLGDDLESTAVAMCEFEVHRRRMTLDALGIP